MIVATTVGPVKIHPYPVRRPPKGAVRDAPRSSANSMIRAMSMSLSTPEGRS
jgi:hypothetical protein